jgi:hypothetical protein
MLVSLSALQMEPAGSSEMLIIAYKTTRRHNPEDHNLKFHQCGNLKSNKSWIYLCCFPIYKLVSFKFNNKILFWFQLNFLDINLSKTKHSNFWCYPKGADTWLVPSAATLREQTHEYFPLLLPRGGKCMNISLCCYPKGADAWTVDIGEHYMYKILNPSPAAVSFLHGTCEKQTCALWVSPPMWALAKWLFVAVLWNRMMVRWADTWGVYNYISLPKCELRQ